MSNISEWLSPTGLTSSRGPQWELESSRRIDLEEGVVVGCRLGTEDGWVKVVNVWESEFLLKFYTLGIFLASPCPRSSESLESLSSCSSKTSWNFLRSFTLRWKQGANKMGSHPLEVQSRTEHGVGWRDEGADYLVERQREKRIKRAY